MKKLFIISTFFLHCSFFIIHCSAQQEFDYLDINNVKAYINPLRLFSNNGAAAFEVPKNSGKTTIFTSNLWLGGLNYGNLYVAAQRYCQQGRDFWLGPIRNWDASFDPTEEYLQKYNRTWKVSREEINYHRAHYMESGYEMPWAIANWPAYSGAELGEIISLAPYKDVNGDGIYNPSQGDYPIIRGDQAVFFIMNDNGGLHTESFGRPIGVEILGMAYAFNSLDTMLQNTIFLSYELRNKGFILSDFYFGFWTDFGIGYPHDDYIGCDTSLNLAYGYNGNEIDGNGQPEAYGLNPPAQGVMFLNQKMSTFMCHSNDEYAATGAPLIAIEYYHYLRGFWQDGVPITLGGDGYNLGSTDYTNWMFSRVPFNGAPWCEETPNGAGSTYNQPGDRRGIMSAGPFTFSSPLIGGENITIDIALPFARTEGGKGKNIGETLALLKQMALEVQEYYDENIVGIKDYSDHSNNHLLKIYPNPSNGQFTIKSEKVIESFELYDILGKKVYSDSPKSESIQISTKLPQGLYFYRAVLQDHSISSGKVVVQ